MPEAKSKAKKPKAAGAEKYSKPQLREKIKDKLKASDKGGRKGQWSARKSQLLVQEYERAGGGYTGTRDAGQKSLQKWTAEKWQTKDGKARARHGKTTDRYLPEKAWDKLTPAQKRATEAKKHTASKSGRQTVANTAAAKRARISSVSK